MNASLTPGVAGRTLADFSATEISRLQNWLPRQLTISGQFRHLLVLENRSARPAALPLLARYVKRAHEEGVERFKVHVGDVHDPRRPNAATLRTAVDFYPRDCESITRQGFYGEIIAGLLAELYSPHGTEWHIPAFCFYAHDLLFQELIKAAVDVRPPGKAMGHFGDDCIAFALNETATQIERILICEAKCTTTHRVSLINDAHKKLSDQPILATAIWLQIVIESLQARNDAHSAKWVPILTSFKDSRLLEQFRDDLISYSHGRRPKNAGKPWIRTDVPHKQYTAGRKLEVFEVHFEDVQKLIAEVYGIAYP